MRSCPVLIDEGPSQQRVELDGQIEKRQREPEACLIPRFRVADGHRHRMSDGRVQAIPGDQEVWLVGERRTSGEQKYYLSNLPADTSLKKLAAAIKAKWICEQAHQQLKEELGLDLFEGRSWTGLHRHCLMAMIAFLQSQRLEQTKGEKRSAGPPSQPSLYETRYSSRSHSRRRGSVRTASSPCHQLICQSRQALGFKPQIAVSSYQLPAI